MSEKPSIELNAEHFAEAFPFFFAFDEELTLRAIGESLGRIVPRMTPGRRLQDCVRFRRPTAEISVTQLIENPRCLYLIECKESPITLRGQIVHHQPNQFLFLGSPWFSDTAEMMEAGVSIEDFAIHDPVIDMLQLLQGQSMALQDAKAFSERLKKQRAALKAANDDLEKQNKIQQQTETELRHQEAEARRLAHVAARTDNAVIITDAAGLTEWVNDGFTKQTGFTLEDMIGKKPGTILQGEETDPETVRLMSERIAQGERVQAEILNYTKTKEKRWIDIEIQPIRDENGNITNFVAIESDITKRKSTEESLHEAKQAAEEANRLKSEFLATVSHEIRTPMNGVMGLSELLLDSELDEKQRNMLQSIRSSATSLVEVINDVLDLSKIESGKLEIHAEPFSLRGIADAVLETVADRCAKKNVELNAIVQADACDHLIGDHGKLRQILVNLVGNAAKFTDSGEVRLEIEEVFRHHPLTTLEFRVIDTGIGFNNDEAEYLFESFRQSDSTAARKHGGTGLGLSITKQLTALLNGKISAQGRPNIGAEFVVKIPFKMSSPPESSEAFVSDNSVLIQILGTSNSATKAIANHLMFLGLPHEIAAPTQPPSSSHEDQHRIIIRDEQSAFPESNPASPPGKTDVITLIPMDCPSENEGSQPILLKPVKFRSLKNALLTCLKPRPKPHSDEGLTPNQQGSRRHSTHPKFKRILIAEDNAVNQQVIREVFHRLGLEGTFVVNGLEVLDAFQSQEFDCILMDCQMPELDGYETTRRIRQLEAQRNRLSDSHTTIIAMTANALFGDREKCLAAGMDDYLAKPLAVKDLESKLFRDHPIDSPRPGTPTTPPACEVADSIQSALKELMNDLGSEAVAMLVGEFLDDSPNRLSNWKQWSPTHDLPTIRLEAHSLKSVCLMYGLKRTAELAQQIESHCLKDQPIPTELTSMIQELLGLLEQEESRLKQFQSDHLEPEDSVPSPH